MGGVQKHRWSKKQKRMLHRISVGGVLYLLLELWGPGGMPGFLLHLIPYLIVGREVLLRAVRNIRSGQVFDENFLMAVATVGAFGCGEYPEAVAVMLFYQIGELFQSVAVARSRESIASLMDIRPDYANIEREGRLVEVDPEQVRVGDVIVVKPGERVPLDGIVTEGASSLDTAALTGESLPREATPGQEIISGCVNLTGLLRVQVTKPFADSTVSRILELVENASSKKAKAENFITRFARYYTPAVVFSALALTLVPPLLGYGSVLMWLQRALIFLVVSCPCALVISIPLSFFGGIGGASKQGILVKGGNYLEALANAGVVVFDKTGTLTRGSFSVVRIHALGMAQDELLTLAALAEQWSDHPISRSIRSAVNGELDLGRASNAREMAGQGIRADVDGRDVWVGNETLMAQAGVACQPPEDRIGAAVHVAVDGVYAGYILVADQVKPTSAQALRQLKANGVRRTVMLTGDSPAAAQAVAAELGLDELHAGLLPGDKVDEVERLLSAKEGKEQLVFVGDGINDAPVLSRADIGVAMGGMGSDAAIEAADIILMDDDLTKLAQAVRIARRTLRIVRQNIVFALGVKFAVLALSAFGYGNMWMAVFGDVGVSVIAILNASRMLRPERKAPLSEVPPLSEDPI